MINNYYCPRRKWKLVAHGPGGCNRNDTPRRKNTHRPTNQQPMCPQGDYVLKFKTFSRLYEPWRINKSITKGKML